MADTTGGERRSSIMLPKTFWRRFRT